MKRMQFDDKGKLLKVDGDILNFKSKEADFNEQKLITISELAFLNESEYENKYELSGDNSWNLYQNGKILSPLIFSNGKTQEDVVQEIINAVKDGVKCIFLEGACGTGKSAIALNVAQKLGSASIVVPLKNLQRQYEDDYMSKKYILKKSSKKMKIASITGRENHASIFQEGVSCTYPNLPENISFIEKNYEQLKEYYKNNPYVKNKEMPQIKELKRMAIAPANPYWSPIIPAEISSNFFKDSKKKEYIGLNGKRFTFCHRKSGCSYYDQYLAYTGADTIIFNSAKYLIECALDRKPLTDIDIIDEADEFLDNFFLQKEVNLTRLSHSLNSFSFKEPESMALRDTILDCIRFEEKNKQALGIDEERIFPIKETQIYKIFSSLAKKTDLRLEIELDENNYTYNALEAASMFKDFMDKAYVTFRRQDKDLLTSVITTEISAQVNELLEKNNVLLFMSGTLHSDNVLKNIFGIKKYIHIKAETKFQGNLEIQRTGFEKDFRYSNIKSGQYTREQYLVALDSCVEKAPRPTLVHVQAFDDLPNEKEKESFLLKNLISKEQFLDMQSNDKNGKLISDFKEKKINVLFSTRCTRGVDFPGEMCNGMVFTKYPNPNSRGIFWQLLKKTRPEYYWDCYNDKARREFLQRLYRALRSPKDNLVVLSPDIRVLDSVRQLQVC